MRRQVATAEFLELTRSMHSIVGRAAAHRHDNHILVPLFSNAAFLPFLKNLLCSMRRLQVRNWLTVSLDSETCPSLRRADFLEGHPHACVEPYFEQPLVTGDRAVFGSRAFWRLVVQRPLWIRWLLTQGYSVLQCDVDIVWLRNPLPHLTSPTEKAPPRRCGTPLSVAGMESAVLAGEHHAMAKHRVLRSILTCPHHNATLLIQSEGAQYGYNVGAQAGLISAGRSQAGLTLLRNSVLYFSPLTPAYCRLLFDPSGQCELVVYGRMDAGDAASHAFKADA